MSILKGLSQRVLKLDGWLNNLSGLGTSLSKNTHTRFERDRILTDEELAALYHGDDVCARMITTFPKYAVARGVFITGPNAAMISEEFDRLQVIDKAFQAACWGKLFGGGVCVLAIDDSREPTEPYAQSDQPQTIECIDVYDRRQLMRWKFDTSIDSPTYRQARTFRVQQLYGDVGYCDRSRLCIFGGSLTAARELEQHTGWDLSDLQRMYKVIRDFNAGFDSAANSMQDFSVGKFTIKGFLGSLSGEGGISQDDLATRMHLMDLMKSIARSIILDADAGENYERIGIDFKGFPDMLDRSANRLAAACEIPVTILMGQAPAGLSATGESDLEMFFARVEAWRISGLLPQLNRIARIIGGPGHRVTCPPVGSMSPVNTSIVRLNTAKMDQINIAAQIYTPEEARGRYGAEGWKLDLDPLNQTVYLGPKLTPPQLPAPPSAA